MRRFLVYSILMLCMVLAGHAQTITRYHYWIDQARLNEATQTVASPASSIQIDWSPDLTGITEGLHTLYYRVQDSNGEWSVPHSWDFFVVRHVVNDEIKVTSLEYWVDGNKAHFTTQAVVDGKASFVLDASDLRESMHTLYYRFKDNEGQYSFTHSWDFFVTRVLTNDEVEVTEVEYWVDTIRSQAQTKTVSGDAVSFTLDNHSLPPGLHHLYYRFKDNEGEWSYLYAWDFFVTRVLTNDEIKVTEVEYWVDTIRSQAQTKIVSGDAVSFTIDANSMRQGLHHLYYRFKDNEGGWSYLYAWDFFVTRVLTNDEIKVTEVEYWVDTIRSQTQTKAVSGDAVSFTIDASSMRQGLHHLYYRFKDNEGGWSYLHGWDFFVVRMRKYAIPSVIECEYWIDEVSDEKRQTVAVTGEETVLSLNTVGMPTGEHTLYYRFKDNEGEHSPLYIHSFIKINPYDPIMILPYDVTELDADMKVANPDYMAYPTEIESQLPEIKCNNPGE